MTANFITALAVKSFDEPDKKRCPDKAEVDLVSVNDFSVARLILAPGWRWSESVASLAGTAWVAARWKPFRRYESQVRAGHPPSGAESDL